MIDEQQKKKSAAVPDRPAGFMRTFNPQTDDPANVGKYRAANPLIPSMPAGSPFEVGASGQRSLVGQAVDRVADRVGRDRAVNAGLPDPGAAQPEASALQPVQRGQVVPSSVPVSVQQSPVAQPLPKPGQFKTDPFGAGADSIPDPMASAGKFMTGKAQYGSDGVTRTGTSMPDSAGGGFTQNGTSYNVNETSQPGISKVTAAGKNPLFTNINPEAAVTGLKNQTMSSDADGLQRIARANQIRQSMIDSQPAGGVAILGGLDGQGRTQQEAENDAKSQRWMIEGAIDAANKAGSRSGKQAASQIATSLIGGQNQQAVEAMRQVGIMEGANVQRRGQDMSAINEAVRAAGNPNDNALKAAQAKLAGLQAGRAESESAMLSELNNPQTTPERRKALTASLLAAQGKSPSDNRYLTTTTKIYNDMGQITGEEPRVFDKEEGKFIGTGQQSKSFGKADVDAAIKAGASKDQVAARIKSMGGNPAEFGL